MKHEANLSGSSCLGVIHFLSFTSSNSLIGEKVELWWYTRSNLSMIKSFGILVTVLLGVQHVGAFLSPHFLGASSDVRALVRCGSSRIGSVAMRSKTNSADIPMLGDDSDTSLIQPLDRRRALQSVAHLSLSLPLIHPTVARAGESSSLPRGAVFEVEDPNTYSAVAYIPPLAKKGEALPLLVVLHGAGSNERSALYEFTNGGSSASDPPGDHTNLPPYVLSTNQAPASLSENFVVVAPYVGKGKRSLYDESRGTILAFIKWFNSYIEPQTLDDGTSIAIDRRMVSLFGFSEGATLAVELATTRQFNGVVVCSYGFTGTLPKMAIEKLQGIPMWVFHSKGDDIYDIQCSNRLVDSLITYEGGLDVFGVRDTVKYTKLVPPQDGAGGGKGREHVRAALVASKSGEVFSWLLSQK